MNRREFLFGATAAAASGFLIDPRDAIAFEPTPATNTSRWPLPFDSAPVLTSPLPGAITVSVAVNKLCTAWVEFGAGDHLTERADASQHGLQSLSGRVHKIRLTGLKVNTTYHYRVVACPIDFRGPYKITRHAPVATERMSFTTPDAGDQPRTKFCVINDTHEKVDTLAAVTSLIARKSSDLTFWNGDVFDDVRSDDQIVANIMRPADSDYAARVPLCFVSGNHDVRGIHARSLDRFIDVPDETRYYLIRRGPVAIIVLDTGEDKPDDHPVYAGLNDFASYRSVQQRWLAQAIQSTAWRGAPFRIAIMHIPLFGGGSSEDSRNKWAGSLEQGQAHLTIHGHTHQFKYTAPDGDHRYGQLVGGGPKIEAATMIRIEADRRSMGALVFDAAGKEIGNYSFKS